MRQSEVFPDMRPFRHHLVGSSCLLADAPPDAGPNSQYQIYDTLDDCQHMSNVSHVGRAVYIYTAGIMCRRLNKH